MALTLDQVSYRYAGGAGVTGIDLQVADGELLAVIGPSGSGKSTLLKLIAGFLAPESGRIEVGGADMAAVPANRRNLGIVFQNYALFPHMSVAENVAYPLKIRSVGRVERLRRAAEGLAAVGLAGFEDRQVASLSGGQQQRVALARALVFQPSGLLLDEPLSALDAALRAEMRDEIRRVQQLAGVATLHVTHDQEEALSIADRVAVMMDGRLLQVASPRTLYDQPADARVAAFVGLANLWPGRVRDARSVETTLGVLACDTAGHVPGADITVLARPEAVRPLPEGEAASDLPNLFSGQVGRDRFLGSIRRYDFATPAGAILGETAFRGAFSRVSIPPEAIRLLPPDTPTARGST
ncbi:ABC transporter ATP-binding protein [Oceanibaculum indicum]|uniref:Iron(III) transport system ATP-binding protein n=1 Tax=Oceanibaculum indicum P24 TaxID=1207063 RepID=K2K7Y2_9PROT|nr:ABC transporter ATP-binding protein [Oceanibaculum indicum]EKE79014.1 iron(III) transport system ATP-binding protein [Oceanibaculum indicum P24]